VSAVSPFADLTDIDRLLSTTKAVRRRLDLERPVPRDVITECIRLACYAPNASNAQDWHWVVVDDPDQRRLVGEQYRKLLEPPVSQMLASKREMGDVAGARISESILYLAARMAEVPVLVIPCFDVTAARARSGSGMSCW
jgi:nitroreductase